MNFFLQWMIADCTIAVVACFIVSYTLISEEFTPSTVSQWFSACKIYINGVSVVGKDKSPPYLELLKMWSSFSHLYLSIKTVCNKIFNYI